MSVFIERKKQMLKSGERKGEQILYMLNIEYWLSLKYQYHMEKVFYHLRSFPALLSGMKLFKIFKVIVSLRSYP